MESSRRNWLKMFGVGAAIVPMVNGIPDTDSTALIVAPPQVELAKPGEIAAPFNPSIMDFGDCDTVVFARDRRTGKVVKIESRAFVMDVSREFAQLGLREVIPTLTTVNFRVVGEARMVTL